jgi:hypothetical protein
MWLKFLLESLPHIIQGVVTIEQSFKATGKNKKQVILDTIQLAAKTGEEIPNEKVKAISSLIDLVVSAFNESGVFKTTAELTKKETK